ncbi:MAG: enoyl-CoA hydratase/isomerase family protein [Pseudomonadota bacterium]
MEEAVKAGICREIAVLTFNRPKAFNAFDLDGISVFTEHLINMAVDDTVRGVVITGEGKAFCAGGDLRWVSSWPDGPAAAFHNLAARYHQAILEIRRMKKPVIAAINGLAAGGGFSLALACDFRIIEASAVLRQAYTSNGLSIDGGGTFMLPRLLGLAKALEIATFDRAITAEQAMKWGLVTKVAEDGRSAEEAMNLAEDLARGSMMSFGYSKQLLNDSFNNSLEKHLELERAALRSCALHGEGTEGIAAFLEKRAPVFNG